LDAGTGVHLWSCAYLLPAEILFAGVDSLSQLIAADTPGLAVARWKIKPRTDELKLEIFQEVPTAVESGLLDAIVLSVVLLRSGQSLGDSPGEISLSNPVYAQVLYFKRH
jgi:hypothetical protein